MEKKIEVVTKEGRIIRIMPHMLDDAMRYDVTLKKPAIREAPKELLSIPVKTVLPKMIITEAEEVKQRKPPVRSRSRK